MSIHTLVVHERSAPRATPRRRPYPLAGRSFSVVSGGVALPGGAWPRCCGSSPAAGLEVAHGDRVAAATGAAASGVLSHRVLSHRSAPK